MEAFSLLKYWKSSGAVRVKPRSTPPAATTTIATSVQQSSVETDEEDNDEGPFFDLEFAVHDDDNEEGEGEGGQLMGDCSGEDDEYDEDEAEKDFNFMVSPSGIHGPATDCNQFYSPSDDLFFKGRLVQLEPSSIDFNPSEPNSKAHFPTSLLKSATKFRVFMLGFKKHKTGSTDSSNDGTTTEPKSSHNHHHHGKFFSVKFKIEEVPTFSIFSRDSNSSNSSENRSNKKQINDGAARSDSPADSDKVFSKDVVQKYMKMIRPLYVRVSKRYAEKFVKFSGQLGSLKVRGGSVSSPAMEEVTLLTKETNEMRSEAEMRTEPDHSHGNPRNPHRQLNFPARLRIVCRHRLRKSKSDSASVAAVALPVRQSERRDDSLLQLQDGIQSAIAHCKNSFNKASPGLNSLLPQCVEASSNAKSADSIVRTTDKGNETSH